MLDTLETVKKEIEDWNAKKVEIIVSESEIDLYNTIINVWYDENNGCTFTMGRGESYQDAINRANNLYKELRYVKDILEINT